MTFLSKDWPEKDKNRNGYIVGGGIVGLASAVFLIDEGYMPGKNITVFEKLSDVGGSMDATKNNQGYVCRGERELEQYMECLWYLCNQIPSIDTPGRTIMEETVDANKEHKIYSNASVLYNQGQIYEKISNFGISKELTTKML